MTLVKKIKQLGFEVGFDLVNITKLSESEHRQKVEEWVKQQHHGSMHWYEKNIDRRIDPTKHLFGKAVTSISVGLYYRPTELPEEIIQDPSRGIIARYALYKDYHKVMEKMLKGLAGKIGQEVNQKWQHHIYVDTGPILERELAEKARLGFTGKNTTLINTTLGSYFFLGEIVCDLDVEETLRQAQGDNRVLNTKYQDADKKGTCGACTRCQDMCPTNAFVEPYVLDARKCISYLTIENRGVIPLELRPLMRNRIYGCDICQEVCPWNKKVPKSLISSLPTMTDQAPHLLDLVGLSETQFKERYRGMPILRAKREGFIRNVLVAIGNWGTAEAFLSAQELLQDTKSIVRATAAWTLWRIDAKQATMQLRKHVRLENNPEVIKEICALNKQLIYDT